MPVRLILRPGGPGVPAPANSALIDLIDEHQSLSIPLGCRSTYCGSCLVRVVQGEAHLSVADDWERETLAKFSRAPGARLACAIVVTGDTGEVELERLSPD